MAADPRRKASPETWVHFKRKLSKHGGRCNPDRVHSKPGWCLKERGRPPDQTNEIKQSTAITDNSKTERRIVKKKSIKANKKERGISFK